MTITMATSRRQSEVGTLTDCCCICKHFCSLHDRVRGYCYSLNQLQTSRTPLLTSKKVQHAWCSLYSMPSLHTVWCGNHSNDLCLAYWCATLRHLHTVVRPYVTCILQVHVVDSRNAIANLALVPQYTNVSTVVNVRVVRKPCQISCTTSTTIGL